MSKPFWYLNVRETGAMEFVCEHGIGHYPVWSRIGTHGCDGCCRRHDFPGREPKAGDFALCGAGTLGLVTESGKSTVLYPDGNTAEAYVGIHMTDATAEKGAPWSSRNPIIVGTIFEMYDLNLGVTSYIVRKMMDTVGGLRWKSDA